jgi:hypothetical protein
VTGPIAAEAKLGWFIPFLGVLTALGPLSNELYTPSLPLVAAGLAAGGGARAEPRDARGMAATAGPRRVIGLRPRAGDDPRSLARRAGVALGAVRGSQRNRSSRLLQRIASYGTILRDPLAVGYMGCTALGFVGVAPLITNSSFVLQGYFGLTPGQFGLCFSLMMLGGSVGAYANSRIVARLGISPLVGFGTASMAVGGLMSLALTLLEAGVLGIVLPGMFYMFGVGFTFANSVARTMGRFPTSMGAASAVFGVSQFLVGALVAAALSLLSVPSPLPLALTTAVAGSACAALWWGWLRNQAV